MVTEDELAQIQRRMTEAGITNAGAYMRKMALNGYILHVDLAPVKELVSLQRRCANNLNQVAVHANTFGVYFLPFSPSNSAMAMPKSSPM